MIENKTILPTTSERIDQIIHKTYPTTTRSLIKSAIEKGNILLDGHPTAKSQKVMPKNIIQINRLLEKSDITIKPNPTLPLQIIYEDDDLIAVSKPAGLPVQPLTIIEDNTLISAIIARYPEIATVGNDPLMGGALHRIDIGTSGLVLAARNNETYEAIRADFSAHKIIKIYHAIVQGHFPKTTKVTIPLAHSPNSSTCKMIKSPTGMFAESLIEPLTYYPDRTKVQITIKTGVTHQIRAHLSILGYPILGDTLYGGPSTPTPGHKLHAYSITFTHPRTHTTLTITC